MRYHTVQELVGTPFIPVYDYGKFNIFIDKICTTQRKMRTLTNAFEMTQTETKNTITVKATDAILCRTKNEDPEYFL